MLCIIWEYVMPLACDGFSCIFNVNIRYIQSDIYYFHFFIILDSTLTAFSWVSMLAGCRSKWQGRGTCRKDKHLSFKMSATGIEVKLTIV
jgi:hypothetical protein